MADEIVIPDSEPTADTTGATEPPNSGKTFTQAELDNIVKERLTRQKAAFDGAAQKAKDEAEQAKLKEQAEWQKLAETHEVKVKELEPQVSTLTEKVIAYEAVITSLLEAKIKALGDTAKAAVEALPGSPDTLAKLQWLNANETLFKTTPAIGPGNQTKTRAGNSQAATATNPPKRIVRF